MHKSDWILSLREMVCECPARRGFLSPPDTHYRWSCLRSEMLPKASNNLGGGKLWTCPADSFKLCAITKWIGSSSLCDLLFFLIVSFKISANCRIFVQVSLTLALQVQVQVQDKSITWREAGNCSGAPSVMWWFWETESAGLPKTLTINR